MEFASIRLARDLFDGRVNAMACIGRKEITVGGVISMLDNVNRILDRVAVSRLNGRKGEGKWNTKTYTYENSRRLFERALKVIPSGVYGHQGPAEGCFIPVDAFPFFFPSGRRAPISGTPTATASSTICAPTDRISWATATPDVDEAARRQREKEDCVTAPSPVMIDFAELLVDTVQTADWAFFAKNGNDVTTLAVMTARAFTRRKKIVFFKGILSRRFALDAENRLFRRSQGGRLQQPLRRLERF